MDELSASFVNEANELLESLEEALLKLENHPEDEEQINTAFRVMHSLKGTGAMFGFEELSAFTHEMESLYDQVRSGKRKVDKHLIDFTFKSIDLIRLLLEKPDEETTRVQKQLLLEEMASKFSGEQPPSGQEQKASQGVSQKQKKQKTATWHIRFEPHQTILQNGTRPLYLLDELAEAGRLKAFLHTEKLPDFSHLIAENVYVWWDLLLVTEKNENFIKDVFIFVEDESRIEIKKVTDTDLLSLPGAEKEMEKLRLKESIDMQKLQQ
ncbi:MAG TPA: chemotaxis protein CheA, partial [Bacteroidetes bacterium]|nr:chemotaxis protein CheA [Bacteroidota bacterium]